MAELIVVTGPPGAGKSTVALALADRFDPSAIVAGDLFFTFVTKGLIAPWLPEANDQNTVVIGAAAATAGRLSTSFTVIYEGVVGPWFLATFAAAADVESLHYVAMLPPVEVCTERVRTRVGHGFCDLPATRDMHRQFVEARISADQVLDNSGADPDAAAAEIHRRFEQGLLIQRIAPG